MYLSGQEHQILQALPVAWYSPWIWQYCKILKVNKLMWLVNTPINVMLNRLILVLYYFNGINTLANTTCHYMHQLSNCFVVETIYYMAVLCLGIQK